jgi:hypothetical protein
LLAEIERINVRQAFELCTALSALSCVFAAVRIRLLPAARDYGLFFWLLIAWFGISTFTLGVPLASKWYFLSFVTLAPLTWVLYFTASKRLYQEVFTKYPGIAFAGRSCLWVAAIAVVVGVGLSVALSPGGFGTSATFRAIMLLDRCVLFGIAFVLVLLVSVMVRYPISIPKNIAIHSFFFSSILFSQTLFQIADQWTLYRFTAYCNTLVAGFDAVLVSAWAIFLTSAGDNAIIRVRQYIRPETEVQLLGQLDALNGILLRAVRK